MKDIDELMGKMLQLIEVVPKESIVESLKQNKGLIDEICAIAVQHKLYNDSATKRDEFIFDIMDKCGDNDDCLVYAWMHSVAKMYAAPSHILPYVVILTMPCIKHFLND